MKNFLFYTSLAIIPISLILRSNGFEGMAFLALIGFIGLFIYLSVRISKRVHHNSESSSAIVLDFSLLLMVVTLFSRYLYYTFWDYPGILTIPLFIYAFIAYLKKETRKNHRIISLSIAFIILTVPLLGVNNFYKAPRQLIPTSWYDPFDVREVPGLVLPWAFKTTEAENCGALGDNLKYSEKWKEAIEAYRSCLLLEHNPSFYFDLAQCYTEIGELRVAIQMLDSVILLDPYFSVAYNNRGLINYKLKENKEAIIFYEKAIELDSTKGFYYSNLGLAYYFEYEFENACNNFKKAEQLGTDLSEFVNRIMKAKCYPN